MRVRVKYNPISYGHIIASWHILYLTDKHNQISPKSIIDIVESSGKLGGSVPAKSALKLCFDYNLIRMDGEGLVLSEKSILSIVPLCDDEDINISAQREILYHIISHHNFEWLIFYDTEADIFRESINDNDPEWANLLENAVLFDFEDDNVNKWWGRVLVKYEDYKEKLKKQVGDVGEKLTYSHELSRVEIDGFIPAKTHVKWASTLSDRFGFDILSIRGNHFLSTFSHKEKIQIEVKSTDTFNEKHFRFFISKPEWIKALENIDSYFFFCWAGINVEKETAKSGPYIIPATDLISHIPKDVSITCEWTECRCVIDVSPYLVKAY